MTIERIIKMFSLPAIAAFFVLMLGALSFGQTTSFGSYLSEVVTGSFYKLLMPTSSPASEKAKSENLLRNDDNVIAIAAPISQNFNTIGASATATLPTDFKVDRDDTNVRKVGSYAAAGTNTQQTAGGGTTPSAGGIYNFGSGANNTGTDRAIGFLASGSAVKSGNLYAKIDNTSGSAYTGLTISYNVEKYRNGTNTVGYFIQLYYSTDGTTWTTAGNNFLTSFPADANNNSNTTQPSSTTPVSNQILSQAIANNGTLYLAWNYSVTSGTTTTNAQALAIDDISIMGNTGSTNTAPAFTSANATTFVQGTVGTFTVTASGTPTPTIALTSGTLPTGVTFTPNADGTGTLAGTPTQAGTFTLTFTATNGISPDATQTFTLTVKPTISLSVSSNTGSETGQTAITVTATVSSAQATAQTVTLGVSGTNITSGDYTLSGGNLSGSTLTIPANSTTGTTTFTVIDDALIEGSETAILTISNPSSGIALGSPTTQNIAITDNDASFAINDVSMAEGNSGTTNFVFTVTRSGDTTGGATVDFATANGTATIADNDYQSNSGTITFAANDTTKTITVLVNGDTTVETNETFFVNLSNASTNNTISDNQGLGTINNDDIPPSTVVINEVYGGSGSANPTYNNDFIELYNNSSTPFNLNGYSIQYGSTAFTSGFNQVIILPNASIPAGGYYLIQTTAVNTPGAAPLPTPNYNSTTAATPVSIDLAGANGNVILVNGTTALGTPCPAVNAANVLDRVAYGTGTCREGSSSAPAGSATTSPQRKIVGVDSNDNLADFQAVAPTPTGTAVADLTISQSDAPDPVTLGNNITYTLTVNNVGAANATGVAVNFTVPTNTTFVSATGASGFNSPATAAGGVVNFTGGTINAGSSATLTVVVTPTLTGTITSTGTNVRVDPSNTIAESNEGNNTAADVTTTVNPPPDTTAPDTTIDTFPSNPSNSSSATFTFSGTDNAGGSGVASFECSLDNATFMACTSGITYASLADGPHNFRVRAIDNAGNVDATPASYTFTVDTTVPTVQSIVRADANPTNSTLISFTVTFSEAVTGVDTSDFTLTATGTISGESVTNVSGSGTTYTVTVNTGSGDGTIRLDLNASGTGITDVAGNPISGGFTTGEVYTIDRTAPVITYTAIPNQTDNTTNPTVSVTVTDANGVPTSGGFVPHIYYRVGNSGSYTSNPCGSTGGSTYNCTIDYGQIGGVNNGDSITYFVAAQDTVGNVSTNPAGGTGADVTTITTPPTEPNLYTIGNATIPAGTYTSLDLGTATLGGNVTVTDTLTLNGVLTTTDNFILTLEPTATYTRPNSSSTGFVEGRFMKQFVAGGMQSFEFPVGTVSGDDDGYTPVNLTNLTVGATGNSLTVRAVDAVSPAITRSNISRHWLLTEDGTITTNLTFTYLFGDQSSIVGDINNLKVYRNNVIECGGNPNCVTPATATTNGTGTVTGKSEFSPWGIGVDAPSAAAVNVGGRVVQRNGRGIFRARVTIIDSQGVSRTAYTNPFGFYRFEDVPAGANYVFTVSHLRYQFAQPTQAQFIGEESEGINFTALDTGSVARPPMPGVKIKVQPIEPRKKP